MNQLTGPGPGSSSGLVFRLTALTGTYASSLVLSLCFQPRLGVLATTRGSKIDLPTEKEIGCQRAIQRDPLPQGRLGWQTLSDRGGCEKADGYQTQFHLVEKKPNLNAFLVNLKSHSCPPQEIIACPDSLSRS